jgi:DNA end-binding protein Ku
VGEREMRIARQLIDSMATDWDPSRYHDTYRERVLDLLERKAEGEEIVLEEPKPQGRVLDLMAALEQSLESARQGGRAGASTGSAAASRSGRGRTARTASKTTRARAAGSATRNQKTAGEKRSGAAKGRKRAQTRDYGSWPKRRLDDEARRLDIPGRSKMDREELVEALQRAS